jgi:hypothetical protein
MHPGRSGDGTTADTTVAHPGLRGLARSSNKEFFSMGQVTSMRGDVELPTQGTKEWLVKGYSTY